MELRQLEYLAAVARHRSSTRAVEEHVGGRRGIARVAATPGAAPGLPGALATFHLAHPGIRISLRHAPAREVVGLLPTGSADLAVAALGEEDRRAAEGMHIAVLSDEALWIVTPAGHPLAAGGERRIADLRDEALVLTERGCPPRGSRRLLHELARLRDGL